MENACADTKNSARSPGQERPTEGREARQTTKAATTQLRPFDGSGEWARTTDLSGMNRAL